jgi:type VI secretion system secreted protein Hcp
MYTKLCAIVLAGSLLVLVPFASAQIARDTLIRPPSPPMSLRGVARLYVTAEGTKQGRFKGQSPLARWQNAVPAMGFSYEMSAPRDGARGLAAATRAPNPIVITKLVGAASPQFLAAAANNELLKSVRLEFVRTDANGAEEVFYTITLTGATVSRVRQYIVLPDAGNPAGSGLLEDISFVFQRIEMSSLDGGTMATDDWGR